MALGGTVGIVEELLRPKQRAQQESAKFGKAVSEHRKKLGLDEGETAASGRSLISSIVGRRASLALQQTGLGKALAPPEYAAVMVSEEWPAMAQKQLSLCTQNSSA